MLAKTMIVTKQHMLASLPRFQWCHCIDVGAERGLSAV